MNENFDNKLPIQHIEASEVISTQSPILILGKGGPVNQS